MLPSEKIRQRRIRRKRRKKKKKKNTTKQENDDEEEEKLARANKWVVKQGLAEGELDYDLFDTESGQQLAVLDLAWPTGLQEGLTEPVALLIEEDSDVEELASQAGFRFFTSVASFRRYVKQEILGQVASSNEEAESEVEI